MMNAMKNSMKKRGRKHSVSEKDVTVVPLQYSMQHNKYKKNNIENKHGNTEIPFAEVCDYSVGNYLEMNNKSESFSDKNVSTCTSPKKKKKKKSVQAVFGSPNVEDMSVIKDIENRNRDLLNVSQEDISTLETYAHRKKKRKKLQQQFTKNKESNPEDNESSVNQSTTNDLLCIKTAVSSSLTKNGKKRVELENGPFQNICTYITPRKQKKQSVHNSLDSQYMEDVPGTKQKKNTYVSESDSRDMLNGSQKNASALENFANHRKRKKHSKRKVSENVVNHSLSVDSCSDHIENDLVTKNVNKSFSDNSVFTSTPYKKKKKRKSEGNVFGSQNVEDISVITKKSNIYFSEGDGENLLHASHKDGLVSKNSDFGNCQKRKKNLEQGISENGEKSQEHNESSVNCLRSEVSLCKEPLVSPSRRKRSSRLTTDSHNNNGECIEDAEHYVSSKQISSQDGRKSKKKTKLTTKSFIGEDSILSQDMSDTFGCANSRMLDETENDDELDYESLLREEISKDKENDLEKTFQDLLIVLNHEIPPLHLLPVNAKRDELLALGMREGHFSKAENVILMANWEKFVQDYEITDPAIFVFTNRNPRSNAHANSLKKDFLQYMGNGLPNRSLSQIYHHFAHLCVHLKRGKFSSKEDNIILKTIKESIPEPFSVLSRVLKRSRQSIHKRYLLLKSNKPVTREKWTISFAEQVVKALMEVLGVSHLNNLEGAHISFSVWHDVEKKLGIPVRKLRQLWNYQLHIQLFAKSPLQDREIFRKMIKWLHEQKPETEKDINYQLSTEIVPGSTSTYMWSVFRRIRRKYNFGAFKTLQDFIESLCKDKYIFANEKGQLQRYKMEDNGSLSIIDD